MSLVRDAIHALEAAPLPDPLTRAGIGWLVERTRKRLAAQPEGFEIDFARAMAGHAIAENAEEANEQHYELPADFFGLVLGPRRKYSCCYYGAADTLAVAEERALEATGRHAELQDGQSILELGCGWGSLSLWMAERYPNANITAVSNSHSQREFIEREAAARSLSNLRVLTADMNVFSVDQRFDRVVSVEMFEHMANWPGLLSRVRGWLNPDGRLFVHVFTHRTTPYRFDLNDRSDWVAQHFFAGGVMPSHGLIGRFHDLFTVEEEWNWNGQHYQRTALDWLANLDRNADAAMAVLRPVYGSAAKLWFRRWRLFFMATAGLFGHRGGEEWGVSHYRLKPVEDAR
jgi:cyclopropane-fatty-acyl-phospholipid synthase